MKNGCMKEKSFGFSFKYIQSSSFAQLCPTLCDPTKPWSVWVEECIDGEKKENTAKGQFREGERIHTGRDITGALTPAQSCR